MTAATAATPRVSMDFEQVRRLLPQRFPLMMVDRVTHLEYGSRIVALKNVTGNEICFLGHFPERAVLPGVLIIEAAAQSVLLLCAASAAEGDDAPVPEIRYLANTNMSFHTPVTPGDQMVIDASIVKRVVSMLIAKVKISVDDAVVARGEIIIGWKT
jgi:3-hydroxyacyl-[acyl-carrier-protein] dehydratase